MLHFEATQRADRRQRRDRLVDVATARAGGKPLTDLLALLKD